MILFFGVMMMKKKIISVFFSIGLCISLICSMIVSAADITSSELYANTIFQPNYNASLGSSILSDLIAEYLKDALDEIDNEVNNNTSNNLFNSPVGDITNGYLDSLYMPDVTYFCGKTDLVWRDEQLFPHHKRATVELYAAPNYKIDVNNLKWVSVGGGYYYPVNCLVYTIYDHDDSGLYSRYFVPRRNNSATMYYLNTTLNDDNDYIAINSVGWSTTAYHLYDQKHYSVVSNFERMEYENRIYWNNTNSIEFPINSSNNPLTIKWGTTDGYPSDLSFINGSVSYTLPNSTYVNTTIIQWWTSYLVVNNPSTNTTLTNSLTEPSQKNWYYEDNITNNTVTNQNSNDVYDGCFNSIFNVDLDDIDITTLIPTIMADLEPTLNAGIAGLLEALLDFFGEMPDFGLTWDSDTTNNYYDIVNNEHQLPTTTGGGDINVVVTVDVDITRPLVPDVTNDYWLSIDVNTQTTATYPVDVVSNVPVLYDKADEVMEIMGLMPILGALCLFGVAVSILFKGV